MSDLEDLILHGPTDRSEFLTAFLNLEMNNIIKIASKAESSELAATISAVATQILYIGLLKAIAEGKIKFIRR